MDIYPTEAARKARSAALRYLSYRPHSERELRDKLVGRFNEQIADTVLLRLKKQGLVDDRSFADGWTRFRISSKPRGSYLIKRELLAKGIDEEIAETAVEPVDDEINAYRVGIWAANRLSRTDYKVFYRRMTNRLIRRGFSLSVIRSTVHRVWDELLPQGGPPRG